MLWMTAAALAADPLVAVVVIDQAAREEGFALELEDLILEDALPVDVAPGEHVRIVDPDGARHELDVAPGEAWEITGPDAEAWMSRIGEDVRSDVLVVKGDPIAVRALATALKAEVVREDGQTLLVRDGILFAAPWVVADDLDLIDEVSLRRAHTARPAVDRTPTRRPLAAAPARPLAVVSATPAAPIVPVLSAVPSATTPVAKAKPATSVAALAERSGRRATAVTLAREPYFGAWLCGDGRVAFLAGNQFSAAGVEGTWVVSAPHVIRLYVGGQSWGRIAFSDAATPSCVAVWKDAR